MQSHHAFGPGQDGSSRHPRRGPRRRGPPQALVSIRTMTAAAVDAVTIGDYQRDGVVYVRQVFDPDEVAKARRAIDAVLAGPDPLVQVASAADDPGCFSRTSVGGATYPRSRNSRAAPGSGGSPPR